MGNRGSGSKFRRFFGKRLGLREFAALNEFASFLQSFLRRGIWLCRRRRLLLLRIGGSSQHGHRPKGQSNFEEQVHFNCWRETPLPCTMVKTPFIPGRVMFSLVPSGQRISSICTRLASPRPKCNRMSLLEI